MGNKKLLRHPATIILFLNILYVGLIITKSLLNIELSIGLAPGITNCDGCSTYCLSLPRPDLVMFISCFYILLIFGLFMLFSKTRKKRNKIIATIFHVIISIILIYIYIFALTFGGGFMWHAGCAFG